jgi:transposase InsO family protein
MPWDARPMSELRTAFAHAVRTAKLSVAAACRQFGISRKTGHKWLARFDRAPDQPLADRSRRPATSPRQTPAAVEAQVLAVRDEFGWGGRKIRAYLAARGVAVPSARVVHQVLARHGRLAGAAAAAVAWQHFERAAPNELWQLDFKGPVEVARQRVHPLVIVDDHSRFLLALRACPDLTMATAWAALWEALGEYGLPEAVLCDHAFGTRGQSPCGVSWFEARLLRLGVRPCHGRPYHPQTQGKVERLNGTLQRELWPHARRDDLAAFQADLDRWRRQTYNPVRPHQALGDAPPVSRWRPSPRPRPAALPAVTYPAGAELRKVMNRGDVSWRGYRILVGAGLEGEWVRVEEQAGAVAVYYAAKQVRLLAAAQLRRDTIL